MMENNPIQVLMEEHEIISSAKTLIENMDKEWEVNEDLYFQTVNTLLQFFAEYSDKFHHQKEEEILFKELRDNPEFLLDEIIDELEGHHEMFRETVREIREELGDKNYEKVQSLLEQYIDELLDHIAVENDELFIMAESLFNESELERMYFLFQDLDMELGAEKKQELANSLSE